MPKIQHLKTSIDNFNKTKSIDNVYDKQYSPLNNLISILLDISETLKKMSNLDKKEINIQPELKVDIPAIDLSGIEKAIMNLKPDCSEMDIKFIRDSSGKIVGAKDA